MRRIILTTIAVLLILAGIAFAGSWKLNAPSKSVQKVTDRDGNTYATDANGQITVTDPKRLADLITAGFTFDPASIVSPVTGTGSAVLATSPTVSGLKLSDVTTGGALCVNSSNYISKCTTVTDASGNCTCP